MDRTSYLCSLINVDGVGLEIGPSYNPLLPKSDGFNVHTVDYTDAEGLRAKYAHNAVGVDRIEAVDYVVTSQSLANTVGSHGTFDYIVASHVIEHTPDMLGFLKDCEILLKPAGTLCLAIPDKRHCFDVLQSLTSTGMVLQAHLDRRQRPGYGSIWDDRAYNAVRDDAIGWPIGGEGQLRFFLELPAAMQHMSSVRHSTDYIDVHVWHFVPSSFRLIMHDLAEAGEIGLREASFHDSVGNEFYMSFSPNGVGCALDRMMLAKQALREHAKIALDG